MRRRQLILSACVLAASVLAPGLASANGGGEKKKGGGATFVQIQTLTAMQRYSGYVITLLPIGLAVILFLISPSYISAMLHKPPEMFGLPMGVIFFGIGLISMGFGYLFIRRIVDIKV